MNTVNRKIDFIGIGAYKSATSTISVLLNEHPEICLSVPKEIRFFNSGSRKDLENKDYNKSIDWYFKHFNHCDPNKIMGEFSPIYLIDDDAPRNIFETFPEVKLLLCIRNPIDRAYSDYQMLKNYVHLETSSFHDSIRNNPHYIENGLYYKHLMRYLEYFDLEKIHIIDFDSLKTNPEIEIKNLYHFLGVQDSFLPSNLYHKSNPAKLTRFNFLRLLEFKTKRFIAHNGGGFIINWLKKHNIHKLTEKIYSKPHQYKPMTENDRNYLQSVFSADIKSLSELLKRDFSSWK